MFYMNAMLIDSFFKVFKDDYKLSTVNMARKLGIEENSLDIWARRLNIELDHHEVESDTNVCYQTFKHLVENANVQNELGI